MYEKFTDRARRVLTLANDEAKRFAHEYIGTEHLLLGLIKEREGKASLIIQSFGVDLRKVKLEIEKLVKCGRGKIPVGKLGHTPRAKKVIELTMNAAKEMGHEYIGTEHLLLGLLRETEGVAAQILMNLGVDIEKAEKLAMIGYLEDTKNVNEMQKRPTVKIEYDAVKFLDIFFKELNEDGDEQPSIAWKKIKEHYNIK